MTDRANVTEIVAGYLATFAIFLAGLAVVYRPVRLATVAMLIVFVVSAMATPRNDRLIRIAVVAVIAGWLLGMTAAVVTESPLW